MKTYCETCGECQHGARNTGAKAPLQPLPVVNTPFEKVAFDIVPRTTHGNRYLLSMTCLFTNKFPEAVPLRRVDTCTVCEAMLEIFARHGLTSTILTDQGSVFMSGVMKQLCQALDIQQIRTRPYHPQSDGALERRHSCLKGM